MVRLWVGEPRLKLGVVAKPARHQKSLLPEHFGFIELDTRHRHKAGVVLRVSPHGRRITDPAMGHIEMRTWQLYARVKLQTVVGASSVHLLDNQGAATCPVRTVAATSKLSREIHYLRPAP